jgi:glycerol kinase
MPDYILAFDQGTTSSRAIVFDRNGSICCIAQREFRQQFPRPGWVEHDPEEIWQSQLAVARQALHDFRLGAADIAAIGIANQRETTVIWDRATGKPIANAIVWQDRRTAEHCERLKAEGVEGLFRAKTGLLLDAYFSGTKIGWLLDHVPGARQRAQRGELAFGTIDSWLTFKLCGLHVTDTSNAARTLLFNIHTLEWDEDLLQILKVPRELLPRIVPSSGVIDSCDPRLFGARIPLAGLAGDQQAASFGQFCHRPGMVKNTYGTGCFMLMNTGDTAVRSQNKLLSTVGWSSSDAGAGSTTYMLEGSVFMAGATVQWLRDGLGIISSSVEVEALAASVEHTDGVVLVPAFSGLGAPHWDPFARGSLQGMSRGTHKGHIARAALESIAFQTADVLQAMQADASMRLSELRVDGGASRNNLLMQFQADILNVPVIRPAVTETTALGAAYLAGLAVGFWNSLAAIAEQWQIEHRFIPSMSDGERQARLGLWHEAVVRTVAWPAYLAQN